MGIKYPAIELNDSREWFNPEIDQQYIDKLCILRDWLAKNPVEFDMSTWREECVSTKFIKECVKQQHTNVCGTSACAIGWAPFAFPDTPIPVTEGGDIDYIQLMTDIFGDSRYFRYNLFDTVWHYRIGDISFSLNKILDRYMSTTDIERIFFIFRATLLIDYQIGVGPLKDEQDRGSRHLHDWIELVCKFIKEYRDLNENKKGQ